MLKLYLVICGVAFLLKMGFTLFEKMRGKDLAHDHEKEHDIGNYIKIAILFLLGLLILYLMKTNTELTYRNA